MITLIDSPAMDQLDGMWWTFPLALFLAGVTVLLLILWLRTK